MGPLLYRLEETLDYTLTKDSNCLAFADDLLLVASDAPKAQNLLDLTVEFLRILATPLLVPKSMVFQIVRSTQGV